MSDVDARAHGGYVPATSRRTILAHALVAYLAGGASAVYPPLGIVGVPLTLLFGVLAILRAGAQRYWPPVALATLGGLFTLLWAALVLHDAGLLAGWICPADCLN